MPRKPSIWKRDQDGFYYTTYKGEQVKLSRDKNEAERAFHTLHAQEPPKEEVSAFRPSFRKLADLYLTYTEQTKDAKTYMHQRYFLQSFCDHVGRKIAAELKPLDVTAWLLKHAAPKDAPPAKRKRLAKPGEKGGQKPWGHNTQVTARGLVVACLNWGVEQGYLTHSPLAKMKVGTFHRRERILSREERDRIRGSVRDKNFRNLLIFLEQTGARPFSEAAQITANMIDWQEGTIPLKKHKNARKGKSRVIYLTPALTEMLREMCKENPTGSLFVTRYGNPYNKSNVSQRIRRLEEKLGIPRFNLYSYRHSWIVDALERGLSSDIVAELCGNTAKTIAKYYNHLDQKKSTLREAAKRAVGA